MLSKPLNKQRLRQFLIIIFFSSATEDNANGRWQVSGSVFIVFLFLDFSVLEVSLYESVQLSFICFFRIVKNSC